MSEWMEADGRFEVMESVRLGLLCFRVKAGVVVGRGGEWSEPRGDGAVQ